MKTSQAKRTSNPSSIPGVKKTRALTLSALKPADYNPRIISDEAFDGLKYSIEEFGDLSGITFNLKTGNLVTGHQRVKALRDKYGDLKIEQLNKESGIIDIPGGDGFKIRFVNWDINKEKAANVAANSETIQGEFTSGLSLVIQDIKLSMPDVSQALMFERLDIPDLEVKVKEDDFDLEKELEQIVEPKTKSGDLYLLGPHKLLCGDCTSLESVNKLTLNEKAQLIFTDPPYNVDYKSQSNLSYNSKKFGGSGIKIFNDNKSEAECKKFYAEALRNLYEVTEDSAVIYWWYALKKYSTSEAAFKNSGWHISQTIIWLKNSIVFSRGQDYHRIYEPCLIGWKKGRKHFHDQRLNNLPDVFSLDYESFQEQFDIWYERRDVTQYYEHPTQKPVRLAERALKRNSRVNDIVLDVFAGSGSTMIACEQLKRKCYSISSVT